MNFVFSISTMSCFIALVLEIIFSIVAQIMDSGVWNSGALSLIDGTLPLVLGVQTERPILLAVHYRGIVDKRHIY